MTGPGHSAQGCWTVDHQGVKGPCRVRQTPRNVQIRPLPPSRAQLGHPAARAGSASSHPGRPVGRTTAPEQAVGASESRLRATGHEKPSRAARGCERSAVCTASSPRRATPSAHNGRSGGASSARLGSRLDMIRGDGHARGRRQYGKGKGTRSASERAIPAPCPPAASTSSRSTAPDPRVSQEGQERPTRRVPGSPAVVAGEATTDPRRASIEPLREALLKPLMRRGVRD